MERTMMRLFDFQRFERNSALQAVIDEVHARYTMNELGDEELFMVNAAGTGAKTVEKHTGKPGDR
ncbi:MAG: hypothetical protein J6U01_08515 [Clostridia bacterium]|nr:hypothetical protein [Clostridia bacterium]